jgi:hypothetical protein
MGNTSPHGGNPNADPLTEFRHIADDVLRVAAHSYGVEDIEPGLERALAVLRRNPILRTQFEGEIVSMLDSLEEGVVELISFVMHDLRWKAIEEEVNSRVLNPSGNVSDLRLYEAILDSFSDSWRDRDLYSAFMNK